MCCLRLFFCKRIRNKLKGLSVEQAIQQLMGSGFKKLLRLWVDEFETATSIRNERQHAFFSKAVGRGGNSGATPSVQRVAVQDFGKNLFLDHEFKFGRRRAQWNTRIRFVFNKVQAGVRQLKKEMKAYTDFFGVLMNICLEKYKDFAHRLLEENAPAMKENAEPHTAKGVENEELGQEAAAFAKHLF